MEFHEVANIFPLMEGKEFNELIEDIKQNGLREAIWTYQGKIIDGRNRYKACQESGIEPRFQEWSGEGSLIAFVISQNLHRRHLTESQRAMVGAKIANMRQGERTDLTEISEKLSQTQSAEILNISPDSIGFAKKVISHGTPELIQAVEKNKIAVSTAAVIAERPKKEQEEIIARGEKEIIAKAKELRKKKFTENRQKREVQYKENPLPVDIYDVIYCDPPWEYRHCKDSHDTIENHYPTMTLEAIKALKIPAADNSVCLMWATAPKLKEAMEVLDSWGFDYRTCMVWDKDWIGMGYWFRIQHELLLVGVKGNFSPPIEQNRYASVFREKRTEHSKKPEILYEMIEKMFPIHKKIELFARNKRDGWGSWGNEIE